MLYICFVAVTHSYGKTTIVDLLDQDNFYFIFYAELYYTIFGPQPSKLLNISKI